MPSNVDLLSTIIQETVTGTSVGRSMTDPAEFKNYCWEAVRHCPAIANREKRAAEQREALAAERRAMGDESDED